jgi:hypothetical protein
VLMEAVQARNRGTVHPFGIPHVLGTGRFRAQRVLSPARQRWRGRPPSLILLAADVQ